MITSRRRIAVVIVALLLTACSGSGETTDAEPDRVPAADPEPAAETGIYLSLGDSYATGDGASDPGLSYAGLLPDRLRDRGWNLDLRNLGCPGETVGGLVSGVACPDGFDDDLDERLSGRSQIDGAIELLESDELPIRLITVSIGGNDVTGCAVGNTDPIACVTEAVEMIGDELGPAMQRLREAAGPDTVIVGLTYPDVILGGWLTEGGRSLAELSVLAFREFINPTFRDAYEAVDGIFVDVTDATGAYIALEETVEHPEHGEIPEAVAEVCDLTWFCEKTDIHPKDAGYAVIADLIAEAVPAA